VSACVGWQVTLCDPIRQVTPSSSEIRFPQRTYLALTLLTLNVVELKLF